MEQDNPVPGLLEQDAAPVRLIAQRLLGFETLDRGRHGDQGVQQTRCLRSLARVGEQQHAEHPLAERQRHAEQGDHAQRLQGQRQRIGGKRPIRLHPCLTARGDQSGQARRERHPQTRVHARYADATGEDQLAAIGIQERDGRHGETQPSCHQVRKFLTEAIQRFAGASELRRGAHCLARHLGVDPLGDIAIGHHHAAARRRQRGGGDREPGQGPIGPDDAQLPEVRTSPLPERPHARKLFRRHALCHPVARGARRSRPGCGAGAHRGECPAGSRRSALTSRICPWLSATVIPSGKLSNRV